MLNRFEFIGNLTKDIQLRKTNNGVSVCNLDIAYNYFVNGQKQTDFAQITVWGKNAEDAAKYLTKGRQVYVDGRIVVRKREIEGKNIPIPEFHADKVLYLGPSNNGNGESQPAFNHPPSQATTNGFQGQASPFSAQNGGFTGQTNPFQSQSGPFGY